MPQGFYSTRFKYPSKKTEKRIKIPQPVDRPLHFQARGLIRKHLIRKDPWWMVVHRRGISRPEIGEDVLEARAYPSSMVRGTLPERILYRTLVEIFHLTPDEVSFQSNVQGGRVELGGLVIDFLLPRHHMVINVQGPTHREYIRVQKDKEQMMALAALGYIYYGVWEDVIYDEYALNEFLRKVLGLYQDGSAGTGDAGGRAAALMAFDEPHFEDAELKIAVDLADHVIGELDDIVTGIIG